MGLDEFQQVRAGGGGVLVQRRIFVERAAEGGDQRIAEGRSLAAQFMRDQIHRLQRLPGHARVFHGDGVLRLKLGSVVAHPVGIVAFHLLDLLFGRLQQRRIDTAFHCAAESQDFFLGPVGQPEHPAFRIARNRAQGARGIENGNLVFLGDAPVLALDFLAGAPPVRAEIILRQDKLARILDGGL